MFQAVEDKLSYEEYNGTLKQLSMIISNFASAWNDWIIDTEAQIRLQIKIDDIMNYLETFI